MEHTLASDITAQSRENLEHVLLTMLTEMDSDSKRYMAEYEKDKEKLEYYSYAVGLMTQFNRMTTKLKMHRYAKK